MSPFIAHPIARVSWALPCALVAGFGLLSRRPGLTPANQAVLVGSLVAAGVGMTAAAFALLTTRQEDRGNAYARTRTHAVFGVATSALIIVLLLGGALGVRLAAHAQAGAMTRMTLAAAHAPAEFPGWYGTLSLPGGGVFAIELDRRGELGRTVGASFGREFVLVVVGIDNRGGSRPIRLDLSRPSLTFADGRSSVVTGRGEVLASATHGRDEILRRHGQPYLVGPGQAMQNALAFLPIDTVMTSLVGIGVLIDDEPHTISGRYLSAEEKQTAGRVPPRP